MNQLYKSTVIKTFLIIISIFTLSIANTSAQTLQLVKDINTDGFLSSSYPSDFNIINGNLFFIANGNGGGYGLWLTTGTDAGTIKLTPSTGDLSNIADIIAYHNKIYFAYNNGGNDYELWVSDGTVAGTKLFKDIYAGSTGSFPSAFTVANDRLFFMANDINGERRLYVSDGTTGGTVVVRNNYINLFNGFADFAVYDNNIYFTGDDGTGAGYGLWKSDGTVPGTMLVYGSTNNGFIPGVFGSNYAVYKNKMYFSGDDNIYGGELWVTDGTAAGTHIVINLASDGSGVYGNGSPNYLQVYNNKLYFSATDDAHGNELFKTDGTAAGTHIVKDITPGTAGSVPTKNIIYNGLLYFSAGGDSAGLWRTDGTDAGTIPVKTGVYNSNFAGIFNGELYLVLGTSYNYAVWQSDGSTTGTKPITLTNTTNPVSSLSNDFKFIDYNSEIYLSATNNDITAGFELCKITNAVLAINLLSFTGHNNGNTDVLNWATDAGSTADFYTVQKSENGITFSSAGTVKAIHNTTGSTPYSFSCVAEGSKINYYKLQVTDKDGSVTYSKVIKLQRSGNNSLVAFYNAAGKQINISNLSNTNCEWKLFSANGSPVKQGSSTSPIIRINTSGLTNGMYIISCTANGKLINTRIAIF
ncbi:MAG: ELWxxDGT repeat protein [Parafilimonas sp.]